jgi:hypothetical protein
MVGQLLLCIIATVACWYVNPSLNYMYPSKSPQLQLEYVEHSRVSPIFALFRICIRLKCEYSQALVVTLWNIAPSAEVLSVTVSPPLL